MEKMMEELLRKYAHGETDRNELNAVRHYLVDNFDAVLEVMKEMHLTAKREIVDELNTKVGREKSAEEQDRVQKQLRLLEEADPVADLLHLQEHKGAVVPNEGPIPVGSVCAGRGASAKDAVRTVLLRLLLGKEE